MRNDVGEFIDQIFLAQTSQDIWEATVAFFANLGFENVIYGQRHPKSGSTPLTLRMTASLVDWRKAYLMNGDDARDPLFSYAAQLPPSFYTGSEFLSDYPYLRAEDRVVILRGAKYGLISGMAFVMPRHDDPVVAGWNIITGLKRAEAEAKFTELGSILQMATNLAHREMVQRDGIQSKKPSVLSPRQAECLKWLAMGLRNDQIAAEMNIRPVTVDMHLRNARNELGAHTREQALAIAISDGLITL